MAGKLFAKLWPTAKLYGQAYQEVWIGLSLMTYMYYKLSYGGKKAVKDSKSSGHH